MASKCIEFNNRECLRIYEILGQYKKAIDEGLRKPKKNGYIDLHPIRESMPVELAKKESKDLKQICDVFEKCVRGF